MPSTFETALSKLASLLGDDTPDATAHGVSNAMFGVPGAEKIGNALNPDPQVTNRASMLPIGNYDDGSVGFAWPQSLIDAKEAFGRFHRGEAPQPQDAVLAGLAMAGSGLGHLGLRASRAGSVGRVAPVEASHGIPMPSSLKARYPKLPENFSIRASADDPDIFEAYAGSEKIGHINIARYGDNDIFVADRETAPAFQRRGVASALQDHVEGIIGRPLDRTEALTPEGAAFEAARGRLPTGETLFSNPKEAAPAGMVAASAGERQGIRAYHGSPHDFDRFDASKTGTGEGNQAYGNGLYFAEAEDVARTYRDSLAGQGNAPQGRMYEVNINANPDMFLDWNKPLSQQSESVRKALEPIARAEAENELRRIESARRMADIRQRQMGMDPKPAPPLPTVEEYMQRMTGDQFAGNENALRDAGITGMRYLDGFSRETGEGTTNYVVFPGNENLIDIMRKYSNPKEAAPAGLLATSNLDRMKAAESAPVRSIPDAPQSIPELQGMIDSNLDRFAVSRSVGDNALANDPARYNAYVYGLHDVMNLDSEWMLNSPTLQSGGSAAPAAATSGEHHSRSQPRGEGGRFVAKDSFDGRLAALDKMLVDLDGDGTPDAVMDVPSVPGNAMMRTAKAIERDVRPNSGKLRMELPPPSNEQELRDFDRRMKGLPPEEPKFAPPPAPGNFIARR